MTPLVNELVYHYITYGVYHIDLMVLYYNAIHRDDGKTVSSESGRLGTGFNASYVTGTILGCSCSRDRSVKTLLTVYGSHIRSNEMVVGLVINSVPGNSSRTMTAYINQNGT